jgi:hypothetical protein
MKKFNNILYVEHNTNLTIALTITRIALNIFFYKYYENNIPLINISNIYDFIKKAYFGGITEVYIPHGFNLIYLDVNSLYPAVALDALPGIDCHYIETTDLEKGLELENLFGFFEAKIKTNNLYLGLLPLRVNGGIINPNGEYYGT